MSAVSAGKTGPRSHGRTEPSGHYRQQNTTTIIGTKTDAVLPGAEVKADHDSIGCSWLTVLAWRLRDAVRLLKRYA